MVPLNAEDEADRYQDMMTNTDTGMEMVESLDAWQQTDLHIFLDASTDTCDFVMNVISPVENEASPPVNIEERQSLSPLLQQVDAFTNLSVDIDGNVGALDGPEFASQGKLEDMWAAVKHEQEDSALLRAKKTQERWVREKKTLRQCIEDSFTEYSEIFEKAESIRMQV
jgi:hypothetical protein